MWELNAPLLDEVQIGLLRGALGDDDLRGLLADLPVAVRQALDKIRTAVAAGDLEEARRAAHALKGVASSFGASRIAAAASGFEAATSSLASIAQGVASFEQLIDETASALDNVVASPAATASPR